MFTIEVEDRKFEVSFENYSDIGYTGCILREVGNREEVGVAHCNPKDNFSRVVGRKVALAKAMKLFNLDKNTRTTIWNGLKEKGMRLSPKKNKVFLYPNPSAN